MLFSAKMYDNDVDRAIDTASYNQGKFLNDLKEQKEIESDEKSKEYISNIETNQRAIENNLDMEIARIANRVSDTKANYSKLRKRSAEINVPEASVNV